MFFISHDDDHEEYLDRVISMLHGQSDCMVYFRDVTELHKNISAEDLKAMLEMLLGDCVRSLDYLPLVENTDIINNILCAGVWLKFYRAFGAERNPTGAGSV